jgi:3-deoxy-manno-octulosonate cytidylyltransferase (CMP-KDO synthetase)
MTTTLSSSTHGHAPFWVLIPARRASSRLPDKPLADIGGVPMVVRVARQAMKSSCQACVVATDDAEILAICAQHGIQAVMTRHDHLSGSDRLAEACEQLKMSPDAIVVNVQGDEPLIPPALIQSLALLLHQRPDCVMATAAHFIDKEDEWLNPNVVKVVTDQGSNALYFSRAPIPWWRDRPQRSNTGSAVSLASPGEPLPLRHIGIYAYRARFLTAYPHLAPAPLERIECLEQLRVLWHGHRIAVHICDQAPPGGVDTPEDLHRIRTLVASEGL